MLPYIAYMDPMGIQMHEQSREAYFSRLPFQSLVFVRGVVHLAALFFWATAHCGGAHRAFSHPGAGAQGVSCMEHLSVGSGLSVAPQPEDLCRPVPWQVSENAVSTGC